MGEGVDLKFVGHRTERADTLEKATGRAVFGTDIYFPGLLSGKVLRSPRPHALIKKIDTSRAKRLPGVRAVVTGADFPDSYWGSYLKDQTIYATDRVRYVGQPIAAVAAVDDSTAQEAVERIDVEYEDLPAVFDVEEAIREDAPLIHPDLGNYFIAEAFFRSVPGTNIPNHFRLRHGDVDKGFSESDEVFEDRYEVPMIQHCPMEPHASVAQADFSGKVTIWSSTQGPYLTRGQVANALGLPMNKVRIVGTYCGGAFGGKISACNEVISGSLAVHTGGNPVRLVFTREEEFVAGFVRQRVVGYYKTGVKRDGRFVARQIRLLWDTGAFGDYEISVARSAGYAASGPYQIPNVHIDSYAVYTNKPVAGAFRGFGVPETCFCYEQQLERIARELGLDPMEVREKNLVREGSVTPTGQPLRAVGLKECLDKARDALGWAPRENPKDRPNIRRGRGVACMYKFTVHQISVMANLKMNEDGSLLLQTAAVEHGQGAHTILRQNAAEELG
ncbi:MAG: xanthine dehydrogenase family protein molybdopterin-binding subunit, partial [Nitrospinota bacterium]